MVKRVVSVLVGLVLLASCAVGAPRPDIQLGESIATQVGLCPDGSLISLEYRDTSKDGVESGLLIWRRAPDRDKNLSERIVGILKIPENILWVAQDGKSYPLDEARQKWPTPCDLPDPGIQV